MTTAVNEWVPQVGAALFQKRLARGEAVLGRFLYTLEVLAKIRRDKTS